MLWESPSMIPTRPNPSHTTPLYPDPAPADYSDEVSDEGMEALAKFVSDELNGEEWDVVDGPGW
jgi:hypothetical protein